MYKLYKPFNKWYERKGTIYFYSDPHFNDADQIFLRPNYIGDEEQVKRINYRVSNRDTIIFLGDIGDVNFIRKIRGYKVLIMGNHDQGITNFEQEGLFDEVYDGPLWISDRILLSHEPIDIPYALNIHGHDHSNTYNIKNPHINLCAELINYRPIGINEIVKSGLLNKATNIHRKTIDEASERKRKREINEEER